MSHYDVINMSHREFPVPGPAEDPQRPLVINYRAPYQSPSTDISQYRCSTLCSTLRQA